MYRALLTLLVVFMAGVASSDLHAQTPQGKACIGVIPAGGGLSFWGEVGRGAQKAGDELGLEVYYRGPYDENTPEAQVDIIRIIERMHCKALVLAPNVPERATEIAQFNARGVPTVLIDRDFGNSAAVAVLATDNFRAGELAAREMARLLPPRASVAVFHMKHGVQSTDDRERGFISAAKAAGLNVVLEAWIGNNVGEARLNAQKALVANTAHLDGVFAPNESTTLATLASLRMLGMIDKVRLIGFDMSNDFIDAMAHKDLAGVVVQRPFQMGYQGVRIAYSASQGKLPERRNVDTGAFFVTGASLYSPEFAQDLEPFLHPKGQNSSKAP